VDSAACGLHCPQQKQKRAATVNLLAGRDFSLQALPTAKAYASRHCHSPRREVRHWERRPVTLSASFGSGSPDAEILRCAQDDSQDTTQVRSSLISKRLPGGTSPFRHCPQQKQMRAATVNLLAGRDFSLLALFTANAVASWHCHSPRREGLRPSRTVHSKSSCELAQAARSSVFTLVPSFLRLIPYSTCQ
jgi:hypothetical protein